jgi:hypothetical protein
VQHQAPTLLIIAWQAALMSQPNNVTTRTVIFSRTDSKIYSWLSLGTVRAGTVKWMWYSPDDNLYDTGSVDIPTPSGAFWPSYNLWYYIPVANIPNDKLGNWRVDISLNGQELLTERFTLFLR